MRRHLLCTALLLLSLAFGTSLEAQDVARVVLIVVPGGSPDTEQVRTVLQEHLDRVEVRVDVAEREMLPQDESAWRKAGGDQAAKEPGTLAVFGWSCKDDSCLLFTVDARSGAFASIPVQLATKKDEQSEATIEFALAATAREVVWGGLLLEVRRLAEEGKHPTSPPPDRMLTPHSFEEPSESETVKRRTREWLWFEGGYHDNYAYPQGDPIHGFFLGAALAPAKYMAISLFGGWMGMGRGENPLGEVTTHRVPLELQLRLAIPVGLTMFSVAAAGRLDFVMSRSDPAGPRAESSSTDVELYAGGVATWHFPLPGDKLDAMMGAGIMGALLAHEYRVDGFEAISEPSFRMTWMLGLAWSPL